MSKSQRTKGAVFEREIAAQFSAAFPGHAFKRNIGQARDGGNDIDVGTLVVECKRRASLKTLRGWMAQASVAAVERVARVAPNHIIDIGAAMPIPIVVMREDNGKEPMVLIGFSDFLILTGEKIAATL